MSSSTVKDAVIHHARLLIDGAWVDGCETAPVLDKFSGTSTGQTECATREQIDAAVASASRSFVEHPLDPDSRYRILRKACELIEARRDVLTRTIVAEAGFPIADAANEVTRAVQTFLVSAEEGKRIAGEVVPIEGAPGQAHRMAFTVRVPRGVVCGITSFNSPLNMVAHKVAPALAAGNTVVMKSALAAPLSAALLFQILLDAGLPPGHANLIQGPGSRIGRWLTENQGIAFYTFTGSTEVGRFIQRSVGLRRIALELGSIAATIVCDDADLLRAATRCVRSAFGRAGQSCTSVQRLFVHASVLDQFLELFMRATSQLVVGDPHDPNTQIGPMISQSEAQRAENWVTEAVAQGARILGGGRRDGAIMYPTVLVDTRPDMRVVSDEIFAPVVSIIPFSNFDDVIDQVNATPFGLACGLFTKDVMRAMNAVRKIQVGLVHINEPSSSRVDLIPFAGVKDSGIGREGPKYAIHEMTEERLVTISLS